MTAEADGPAPSMSADMQRLCEIAASRASWIPVSHDATASEAPADWEPVVRAILVGLQDPSPAVLRAMRRAMSPARRPTADRVGVNEKHAIRWRAGIAAALGEKWPAGPEIEES